jgi:23S rRNA pseudouridine1911/1915/1917 synthase
LWSGSSRGTSLAFSAQNSHHAPVSARHFSFTVTPEDAGLRIDQLVAKHVPGLSRRTARKVLLIGGVFVESARVKIASKIIQPGHKVDVHLGGALATVTAADKMAPPELDLLFEDEHLLVVDKPAHLATAATRESDRHNLLYYLSQRPSSLHLHLVHRLDMETSGLLVVAKTADAAHRLSELFRTHDLERIYHAAVLGDLQDAQTVDEPIEGRPARSTFTPVERRSGVTLAEARLETGRTHQIRIHALHMGHPVLRDPRYGRPTDHDPPRLALHARVLGFHHPTTDQPMRFEREWPADLRDWWQGLAQEKAIESEL